jgi:hypothetical protein
MSGIFISADKVLLFAAPSRTGKSTTALMLHQKGYALFSDDTVLLHVENGRCMATPSYPMIKLWQSTFKHQMVYDESAKNEVNSGFDKFAFMFHQQFSGDRVEVAGVVFLEEAGTEIKVEALNPGKGMKLLGENVYRRQWVRDMEKHQLEFQHLTDISRVLKSWKATRPVGESTFESFADVIEQQIVKQCKTN